MVIWLQQFLSVLTLGDYVLVLSVILFTLWVSRFGMWPYSLVTFPGVLAHELTHFFVALLFLASPSLPNMIPRRNGDSWTMGSVNFAPTFLNAIPVSLAPFLLLPIGVMLAVYVMHPATGFAYLAWGWVTGNVLFASLPSRQDWKVAAPTLVGVALIVGVVAYFRYH